MRTFFIVFLAIASSVSARSPTARVILDSSETVPYGPVSGMIVLTNDGEKSLNLDANIRIIYLNVGVTVRHGGWSRCVGCPRGYTVDLWMDRPVAFDPGMQVAKVLFLMADDEGYLFDDVGEYEIDVGMTYLDSRTHLSVRVSAPPVYVTVQDIEDGRDDFLSMFDEPPYAFDPLISPRYQLVQHALDRGEVELCGYQDAVERYLAYQCGALVLNELLAEEKLKLWRDDAWLLKMNDRGYCYFREGDAS